MLRLAAIALAVVAELTRIGQQHSCIFAGVLTTKVLHRLGHLKAYPMTVRAFIFNPQLYEWVKANDFDDVGEREAEWSALGGRGVSLGEGRADTVPSNKWLGHMAVILPDYFGDRHAMLDLTMPQAQKLEWGLRLPPMLGGFLNRS